jgi:Glycosyltransferase like family 2
VSVAVVIPWSNRGIVPAERSRALGFVLAYYNECFPGFPLRIATDDGLPFSRARAVNRAVDSLGDDVDTIVINDADALVPSEQLSEAIEDAQTLAGFVQPFTIYRKLSQEDTEDLQRWQKALAYPHYRYEFEQEVTFNQSVCVVSYAHWMETGGYDERYVGWGYEDLDLEKRMLVPLRRIEGPLVHLWHPPAEPNPANEKLYRLTHG